VSEAEAERELRHTLADVERGVWRPQAAVEAPREIPTFHEFAAMWWDRYKRQLAPSTRENYCWRLETHLLPFFAAVRLDEITFDLVERYVAAKLGEDDPLSPRSINMTVTTMAAILEVAVERELIARNPAKGRGRRVRERAPRRSHLESAQEVAALLAAAGELDREARADRQHVERRAMISTLTFAGLRIGELLALRWRHVDLAAGWLEIGEAKTDAGRRRVKLRGAVRDELLAVRSRRPGAPDDLVFPTGLGGEQSPENFRRRVLGPAVKRASERLVERGLQPLPDRLTPHSLRRTFASVLYALGEDPGVVMDEMGHTDPGLALRVYRQTMRRGDDEKQQLRALVEGRELAVIGIRGDEAATSPVEVEAA
jgi:integrase